MEKIKIGDLSKTVMRELYKYADEKNIGVKKSVKTASKIARQEIRNHANVLSGKYRDSWQNKTVSETASRIEIVTHSPKRYMLTHLLENGHFLWNRPNQPTRAFPTIEPAEQKAIQQLEKDLERVLGDG